ncbi:MAG: hypothetical protein QW371_03020 [Candidatus Bathyarchaeia archaeon]
MASISSTLCPSGASSRPQPARARPFPSPSFLTQKPSFSASFVEIPNSLIFIDFPLISLIFLAEMGPEMGSILPEFDLFDFV